MSPAVDSYKSAFTEYVVVRQIGEGGSGIVYEVVDPERRRYALKALDPRKSTPQKLKRFQNEITFCQETIHNNVVRVLDTGRSTQGRSFYVMDLYPCTLQDTLTKLKPEEALPVFSQVLDGVEAAHLKSVVHRDLKPQNVLCDPHKNLYVIADFGIASFAEEDLYTLVETRPGERLANFQYAAPEQRTRGRETSFKTDVYALGLILNQMFTGEIPLGTQFKKIEAVAPTFSYLDGIVETMIRQDPAQRPSIADVKMQLIARREQYVSLQKINELTKQVVPEGTITDPLIVSPIRAQGFDYRDEYLLVTLSQVPNAEWIQQFQNQSTGSFLGMGPNKTTFRGPVISVPTRKSIVVQQRSYVEGWIRNANGLYEEAVKRRMALEKRSREQAIQEQLARERERQEILKLLNSSSNSKQ
jgi:serine/threonine protein kinase